MKLLLRNAIAIVVMMALWFGLTGQAQALEIKGLNYERMVTLDIPGQSKATCIQFGGREDAILGCSATDADQSQVFLAGTLIGNTPPDQRNTECSVKVEETDSPGVFLLDEVTCYNLNEQPGIVDVSHYPQPDSLCYSANSSPGNPPYNRIALMYADQVIGVGVSGHRPSTEDLGGVTMYLNADFPVAPECTDGYEHLHVDQPIPENIRPPQIANLPIVKLIEAIPADGAIAEVAIGGNPGPGGEITPNIYQAKTNL